MPLRRRLLLLVFLVLAISLLGGGVLTYWHGVGKIETEMQSAREVGESAVRDALSSINASGDANQHLRRIVSSFDGDRHLRVSHVGTDGAVIATSRVSRPTDPPPTWLHRALAGPPDPSLLNLPAGLESLGHIVVEPVPTNEIGEVWEDAKLKLVIIGGFCALVLALTYAALGRALRPLESLCNGFARVGQGDYRAHVDEAGPRELTIIYKAFNQMAETLDQSERQNRRLGEQLSTVQEEERSEIARDLHDEIGPFLFAVDVDAQTIPALLEKGDEDEVAVRARAIRQSVGHMQKHLRSVLSRLRPALLLDLGLVHAVDHLVAFWRSRRPAIIFTTDIEPERLPPAIEEAAFRVLQEGTNNAIRHGQPTRIALYVRRQSDGGLRIMVSDDGSGLAATAGGGFGLKGMRERVRQLGGTLSLSEHEGGRGVLITAELPLPGVPPESERVLPQRDDNHEVARPA